MANIRAEPPVKISAKWQQNKRFYLRRLCSFNICHWFLFLISGCTIYSKWPFSCTLWLDTKTEFTLLFRGWGWWGNLQPVQVCIYHTYVLNWCLIVGAFHCFKPFKNKTDFCLLKVLICKHSVHSVITADNFIWAINFLWKIDIFIIFVFVQIHDHSLLFKWCARGRRNSVSCSW